MASKQKQERRRQRAKCVKKNKASRKVAVRAQMPLNESAQTAQRSERRSNYQVFSALMGVEVFGVGDPGNPRSFKRMEAAMETDNGPLFKSGLEELASDGLSLLTFRLFEDGEMEMMDVFEWAIHRRCRDIFLVLANFASQEEEDFARLIEKVCYAVEDSCDLNLRESFAANLFGLLAQTCLRQGILLRGPAREGRCGMIWDAMALRVEAERQQAMLLDAIPDLVPEDHPRAASRL